MDGLTPIQSYLNSYQWSKQMGRGNRKKRKKPGANPNMKKKTAVQQAAAKRHANFKKTGVQTFGGTKKKYSKKEAEKIEKAGLSFSKVTGGAANPLNRAPTNEGVEAGDLMQPVKDFAESLPDYSQFAAPQVNYDFNKRPPSDISFGDAVRSGARFNQAGTGGPSYATDTASLGGYGLFKGIQQKTHYDSEGKLIKPTTESFMDNEYMNDADFEKKYKINKEQYRNLQGMGAGDGTLTATHDNRLFKSVPATGPAADTPASDAYKEGMLQKNLTPSSPGNIYGIKLAAAGDLSGLGIGAPKATGYTPTIGGLAESLGLDPKTGQEVGTSAGGLNIGGDYGLSIGNMFNAPTNNRMLSEGGTLQMSDMFQADTQGANIAKGINFVKNKIPLVNMLPDMKINSVAEEAQRRYLGYNPNLPASALARMDKKGGGGTRLPLTPTVAQEVAPQYQPVPSASTTPTTQTGVDPNRLLQIQQQAYAQAYNPMLIGGFNPQFRLGAATPTIDYSTYFNY